MKGNIYVNSFDPANGKLHAGWREMTGEADLGLFGAIRILSADVANDPIFGLDRLRLHRLQRQQTGGTTGAGGASATGGATGTGAGGTSSTGGTTGTGTGGNAKPRRAIVEM
jgi:hypothetical protein